MMKGNFSVLTTKKRTFKDPRKAAVYAKALYEHGQISNAELKGVEKSVRGAEKQAADKGK